ncbi:MAG TPA: hypothetical protein H9805_09975 [Candidatus Janibacter merdipullorum]|nr:hypothetical protein [Candidatus Janibacter merdipullorum]
MATSRLAQHLPSLFGPSRRAAWRLSLVRRGLAAAALLLALHLTLGATRPAAVEAPSPPRDEGAAISLPLAAPADHLSPGDEVGVYLPGRSSPVVRDARVLGTPEDSSAPVVRLTFRQRDVEALLREMGPGRGADTGFVVVRGHV